MLFHFCVEPDPTIKVECDEGYIPCVNDITNCCPDTVSHEFEWTTFRSGEVGGPNSGFNGAAIDSDGGIWVVGQVFTDSTTYELAVFDGLEWELRNVEYEFRDHVNSVELFAIAIVNDSLIWTYGSLPLLGNGIDWMAMDYRDQGLPNISVSPVKLWCEDVSSCLFVGREGRILRYDDGDFHFLDSPIGMTIRSLAVSNGNYFAAAYENSGEYIGQSAIIYSLDGENWQIHKQSQTFYPGENSTDPGIITAVISFDGTCYYTTPYGIYQFEPESGIESQFASKSESRTSALTAREMSGNSINDFMIYGGNRTVVHHDGYNWWRYQLDVLEDGFFFTSILFEGDTVLITGGSSSSGEAIVVIGRR